MNDCIFCKIIAGEIPSYKVYEDGMTLAFLDIKPVNPGHTLVVPKKHYKNILDIPEDQWLAVMRTVHILAPKIKKAVSADGINIGVNNEGAAHQLVFHTHVHIMPRFEGDGYQPWGGGEYKEGEAQATAEKIKNALKN